MRMRDSSGIDLHGVAIPTVAGTPRIPGVSEFTRSLRRLLEEEIGEVWVQGEVSNLRRHTSGHTYFTLKDETAQLACVLFRRSAPGLPGLADGMAVQVFGRVTVYESRGQYQLVAQLVQETGVGVLQARFEALKRRLQDEGLFDPARKQSLPRFPKTIGLITSPTGAAIRDVLNVFARRAPFIRICIAPTPVQGAEAAPAIVNALAGFEGAPENGWPMVDVVILTRGGGSIEDLWAFNDETLARAIAASRLPIVSAVGHEIDFTIADFAADVRAPTPSVAAELTTPDGETLRRALRQYRDALERRARERLHTSRIALDHYAEGTLRREIWRRLADNAQSLDRLGAMLQDRCDIMLRMGREKAAYLAKRLGAASPARRIADRTRAFRVLRERFSVALPRIVEARGVAVRALQDRLRLLGPQGTLDRGYSVTLFNGRIARVASEIPPGQTLETRLAKGRLISVVSTSSEGPPQAQDRRTTRER